MINVAVAGLGWWGSKIVGDLQESTVVNVTHGVDPRTEVQDEFASQINTSLSFDEVLLDSSIDAVILCTPHNMHVDQICKAAAAGKHVFCEKPLATTGREAAIAIEAVKEAGVQLGIGHERRAEPAVRQLVASLRAGELGVPLVFEGNFSQDFFLKLAPDNWRLSAKDAPVGPLSATGIHIVDLAICLLGRPVQVGARLQTLATNFANGDTLTISLAFEGGQSALITAALATPFVGRVALYGSDGWVEIRDRNHPEESAGWEVTRQIRGERNVTEIFPAYQSVRSNIEDFGRAVAGDAPYPVSLEEMLLNAQTFEAITRSVQSGNLEPIG